MRWSVWIQGPAGLRAKCSQCLKCHFLVLWHMFFLCVCSAGAGGVGGFGQAGVVLRLVSGSKSGKPFWGGSVVWYSTGSLSALPHRTAHRPGAAQRRHLSVVHETVSLCPYFHKARLQTATRMSGFMLKCVCVLSVSVLGNNFNFSSTDFTPADVYSSIKNYLTNGKDQIVNNVSNNERHESCYHRLNNSLMKEMDMIYWFMMKRDRAAEWLECCSCVCAYRWFSTMLQPLRSAAELHRLVCPLHWHLQQLSHPHRHQVLCVVRPGSRRSRSQMNSRMVYVQ